MGGSLRFGKEEVRVRTEFSGGRERIVIRDSPMSSEGRSPDVPIFWEGWAWEEKVLSWTDEQGKSYPGWLGNGKWKRAEILATAFNERFRWYEVPPHEVVKAIVLEREHQIIMKVLTRKARNREKLVTGTKPEEGPIQQARFTCTGPQRVYSKRA